jgi:hypothetical protein
MVVAGGGGSSAALLIKVFVPVEGPVVIGLDDTIERRWTAKRGGSGSEARGERRACCIPSVESAR